MATGPGPASRSGSIAQTKTPVFKEKLLTGEKFLKWTDQVCFRSRFSLNVSIHCPKLKFTLK